MRKIKFRVWKGKGIGMEYNIMAGFLGAFYVKGIDENDSASMSRLNTKFDEKYCAVMQYTGLNDKNGKEIYEGDIVRVDKKIGHIKYRPAAFVIYYKEPIWEAEGSEDEVYSEWCHIPRSGVLVEVIGNIYENPE